MGISPPTPGDCEKQQWTPTPSGEAKNFSELQDEGEEELASQKNLGIYALFRVPNTWRWYNWFGWSLGSLLTISLIIGINVVFWVFVIGSKPVKGVCTSWEDMTSHFCILAAGQKAMGLFAFGQITIGLFCIGQVNLALIFGLGQVAITGGYVPVAQVAVGILVEGGQLAFALVRVRWAQLGFNVLRPFFRGPAIVSCHRTT